MTRTMKDSGIEWIGKIPDNWEIDRLQWHLFELNVKNNPIINIQPTYPNSSAIIAKIKSV